MGPLLPPAPLLSPPVTRCCHGKPRQPPLSLTTAALPLLTMVDPGLLQSSQWVAEALGTGSILAKLATILVAHSWTARKDATERTGQGLLVV